jgi:thiol:disulfide interchange protein DsbG
MNKMPLVQFALLFSLLGMAIGAQGVEVMGTFAAPDGLTGYAGVIEQKPLAIYLTSDGKKAIIGTMIDDNGNNLSEAPLDKLVRKPMTVKIWKQLEKSTWIADGRNNAPRVIYVFTDPNCPYCNKFWKDARPWVKAGKAQLRHIVVAILTPTSAGKAAALLSAKNPEVALTLHEQQHADGGIKPLAQISAKIRAQLDANQNLMQQLGASATPTILYKDDRGNLQTLQGAPSAHMLTEMLGQL